jgi:WD40 repeat protein
MTTNRIQIIVSRTIVCLAIFLGSLSSFVGAAQRYWEADQGEDVTSVRISSSVSLVATGGYGGDAAARLWDARTGALLDEFPGHEHGVVSVDISPDETMLAVGYIRVDFYNAVAKTNVYDIQTRELLYEFGGAYTEFSADGSRITCAGGTFNRYVNVFELPSGDEIASIYTGDYIYDMAFSSDGNVVATCSGDPHIVLWDVNTGTEIRRFSQDSSGFGTLAFSDDDLLIAAGVTEQYDIANIHVWNAKTGEPVQSYPGHETGVVYALDFSPDGTTLLSTGRDVPVGGEHSLRLWSIETGEQLAFYPFPHSSYGVQSADYAPMGQAVVIGLGNGMVITAGAR